MLELFIQYLFFLLKSLTIVICIIAIIASFAKLKTSKNKSDKFSIESWSNDHLDQLCKVLKTSNPKKLKTILKKDKKERKNINSNLYVIEFNGDIMATETEGLRKFVDCLITIADTNDQVLVKLDSKGGSAPDYGLAATQLSRIKKANIPMTISVDKFAASGGYLMACCADKIIAAPFAILGSIGVVINMPNFYKLLKNNHIEFNQITAGKYKRTLTPTSPVTKDAKDKVKEDAKSIHTLFKSFILDHRPQLDIEKVSTGEHWTGHDAIKVGLIDELMSSDEFIINKHQTHQVYKVTFEKKKTLVQKLSKMILQSFHKLHKSVMI